MSIDLGVGVVVRRGGRLLLGRREKAGEPASWALPGGLLEAGESFEQAALRELAEETGLRAGSAAVFALGLTPLDGGGTAWTAGLVADDVAGDPEVLATHEFTTLAWFDPGALPDQVFGPTRFVLDVLTRTDNHASIASYTLQARNTLP